MGGNSTEKMSLKLKIWRQQNRNAKGAMIDYQLDNVSPDMSFLEMLDTLNEKLVRERGDAIAFDHDCREGICGMCSLVINGQAHGPEKKPQLANSTCENLKTVTRSSLSLGEQKHSQLKKT